MSKNTIIEIARRVGVSPATVSRALNNVPGVSPDKRRRILAVAEELNYHPNVNARGLQGQRANVVAYVVDVSGRSSADLFFFKDFIAVLADRCVHHGMDLLIHPAAGDDPTMRQVERLVRSHRADGVLLSDTRPNDARIAYLDRARVPFITFGHDGASGHSYVDVDGERGTHSATCHLIERGHRRVAFLGLPLVYCWAIDRQRGYLRALRERGLPQNPALVEDGLTTESDTRAAIERLLSQAEPPSAFVAASDMLALQAMSVAAQRWLRAGRDYAITGFDDLPLAAHTDPPLTTLRQPLDEVCDELIARLARIIAGEPAGEPALLAPELIVRGST
jgi:LacI family transcriptional regulator, galactose operon repressor